MTPVRRFLSVTRSILVCGVFAAAVSAASAQTPPDQGALLVSGEGGVVTLRFAVTGSDGDLTLAFPAELKTYLTPAHPTMSLTVFLDTDNNANSGLQTQDARRGADYGIDFTIRLAGEAVQATPDDVTVVQYDSRSSFGTFVPAKGTIRTDATTIDVTVPLSAIRMRKAKAVRLIAETTAGGYVDRVFTVR